MFEEGWLAENPHAGLILYSTLGAVVVAGILLTNWPTYHFLIRGGPIPLWYYVLPGILILPIIFAEPGHAIRPFTEPLFWWFIVYVVSGGVWLLLAQDFIEDAAAQWRLRILSFFFFYTITILTSRINRPVVALAMVGCVLIACAGNWFDVLRPFRFVPQGMEGAHTGRGAGFFINPNVAGSFIAMATIVALPFIPMRFRALVILCAVVGIVPTFSRSGFLYAGLILFGAMLLKLLNRSQALLIIVIVPILIGTTAVSYDYLMASSDDANLHLVVRRLEWFQGTDETDEAAEGRLYGARQAWQIFLQEPVTGRGLGVTTLEAVVQEGPHNMYLMFMAEQGFLGLALYLTLIAIVARHGRRLARTAVDQEGRDIGNATLLYAGFLATCGFFSHNLLEEAQSIFVMAFITAAVMSAPRVETWVIRPTGDFPHRERIAGARPKLGQP